MIENMVIAMIWTVAMMVIMVSRHPGGDEWTLAGEVAFIGIGSMALGVLLAVLSRRRKRRSSSNTTGTSNNATAPTVYQPFAQPPASPTIFVVGGNPGGWQPPAPPPAQTVPNFGDYEFSPPSGPSSIGRPGRVP